MRKQAAQALQNSKPGRKRVAESMDSLMAKVSRAVRFFDYLLICEEYFLFIVTTF